MSNNSRPITPFVAMPPMPKSGRKNRPVVACACGCGAGTRGTWHSGHDGRATGWAIRIERGLLTIEDVPSNERAGARIMLDRHAKAAQAEKTGTK